MKELSYPFDAQFLLKKKKNLKKKLMERSNGKKYIEKKSQF